MNNMEITDIDVQTILPQQRPFVMISTLLQCDMVTTKTNLHVAADNLFCYNGVLIETGIIENIAQTCAARMGYINSIVNTGEVRVGFIGSVRNLQIYRLPKVGETIETQVDVQSEVFNITLVLAKVTIGNEVIADCEMKISEQ